MVPPMKRMRGLPERRRVAGAGGDSRAIRRATAHGAIASRTSTTRPTKTMAVRAWLRAQPRAFPRRDSAATQRLSTIHRRQLRRRWAAAEREGLLGQVAVREGDVVQPE